MISPVLLVDIFGWPLIQVCISKMFLSLPAKRFRPDNFLFRIHPWEQDGRLYSRGLRIRRWKRLLPDGAPWLGGFAKAHFAGRDAAYAARFLEETCRGEFAHWCMLACTPVFFLWNPPWACWTMAAYGVLANLPCIAVQRYNRIVIRRILENLISSQ